MTLPKGRLDTRRADCPSCGKRFAQTLDEGRPDVYCLRCRKDYALYPGAMRRHRERLNRHGIEATISYREVMNEIRARLIGVPEEDD